VDLELGEFKRFIFPLEKKRKRDQLTNPDYFSSIFITEECISLFLMLSQ
jgi:hypothetical protein